MFGQPYLYIALTNTNNREAFVDEDTFVAHKTTRPVRTAVAQTLGASDEPGSIVRWLAKAVGCKNSAHEGVVEVSQNKSS